MNGYKQIAVMMCMAALAAAAPASASLVGASVTGSLIFPGFEGVNYYDPANGFVPGGAPNAAAPTVTVIDPGVEFQFADGFSHLNTDVGEYSVDVLQSPIAAPGLSNGWTVLLTGLTLPDQPELRLTGVAITSTIPGLTSAFGPRWVSLTADQGPLPAEGWNAHAVLTFTDAPEPKLALPLGIALLMVSLWKAKQRFCRGSEC
jgi:hypothetical protein